MMVTVDKTTSQIVVQHTYQGAVIKEYRGSTSEAIERELARDEAISDISHALYVGRELARAENRLGEATPK
jgi:thymidylate synthase